MGTENDLLEDIWGDFLIESDRRSSDMWYSWLINALDTNNTCKNCLKSPDICIIKDSEIGIFIYHGVEGYVELYKSRDEIIKDIKRVNKDYDTIILRWMDNIIDELKQVCKTEYNTIYYIIYETIPLRYVESIQKEELYDTMHRLQNIKNINNLCNLYSLYCRVNYIYNSLIYTDIEEMIPLINKETIDTYNKEIFNNREIDCDACYGIIKLNTKYKILGSNKHETIKEMIDNIKRWVSVKDRYSIDSVFRNLY